MGNICGSTQILCPSCKNIINKKDEICHFCEAKKTKPKKIRIKCNKITINTNSQLSITIN